MKKKFEVWSEGYNVTGDRGKAKYHGIFKGDNFRDAVINWKNTLSPSLQFFVDIDRLVFWGCKLFDNGKAARKSFG